MTSQVLANFLVWINMGLQVFKFWTRLTQLEHKTKPHFYFLCVNQLDTSRIYLVVEYDGFTVRQDLNNCLYLVLLKVANFHFFEYKSIFNKVA